MSAIFDDIPNPNYRPSAPVLELAVRALRDFDMLPDGSRVAVGLSGGKDSLLLAMVFAELSRRDDFSFEWTGVHLDQNQPGFDRERFEAALDLLQIPCVVVSRDTHSIVQAKLRPGQIPCAICGRLRRGVLNDWCVENGWDRLALGHHLDDAIETFFLNLLYGRRLEPLKPVTPTASGEVATIRPLVLVEERKIADWAERHEVPTVACPVCDDTPKSRRRDIKRLVAEFAGLDSDVHASVRAALYDA